jgi:hypothetical protein
MRLKALIAVAVMGVSLITAQVAAHHKHGHQSPNTPIWGLPEHVDCDAAYKELRVLSWLMFDPAIPDEFMPYILERLSLLRNIIAIRCARI